MKVYIVWFRNDLAGIYKDKEKAKQVVKNIENDYNRKGVAWIMEEEVQ